MGKDLRSMMKNKKIQDFVAEDIPKDQEETAKAIKKQVDQYSKKSEGELLSELKKAKQNGMMDAESLRQFVSTVGPMLNGEQKKRLKEVIAKLK